MDNLMQVDDQLNEMTRAGQILEALERFYSEGCTFQEGNQGPRVGRNTQRDHLSRFFDSLKEFKGATLHSQGIDGNVTPIEVDIRDGWTERSDCLERNPATPVAGW